jgi:hypothetical protein
MAWVGFELTTPAFERAKTFHVVDHAATAIGQIVSTTMLNLRHRYTFPYLHAYVRVCVYAHIQKILTEIVTQMDTELS